MSSLEVLCAWERAVAHPVYVVVYKDTSQTYIETPEEAGTLAGQPEEALLRVFLTEEEAFTYLLALETYVDEELILGLVRFEDLFRLAQWSTRPEQGFPVRVELAAAEPAEWPTTIDVVWTAFAEIH